MDGASYSKLDDKGHEESPDTRFFQEEVKHRTLEDTLFKWFN